MLGVPGDENFFSLFRLPGPLAESDFEALIQDNPELAAAAVTLEGKSSSRVDGDDFDAISQPMGKRTKLSPWTGFFSNPALELSFSPGPFLHVFEKLALDCS